MTVGNIATDGYGLNVIEKPNVPVNGYGVGVPTGLFAGSVTATGIATELVESFFDELLVIDAELEAVAALLETVEVTELVGYPLAQSLMTGVDSVGTVVDASHDAVALEGAGTQVETMGAATGQVEALEASQESSGTLDATPGASSDMMGSDDTETGVL